MKLYYSNIRGGNFGDELNLWLWPQLLPIAFDDDDAQVFVGIGTLLNERLNERVPKISTKLIFGSGVGYGDTPQVDDSWRVYFVRGPLSAEALDLDQSYAITDGAVLLRGLPQLAGTKRHRFSYMPHHKSATNANWAGVCHAAGIHYIDPSWSVQRVLEAIQGTEIVLAEAMHAAIVADILRVPWLPIRSYEHVLDFKWRDWCLSMGLEYRPHRLPEIWDQMHHLNPKQRVKAYIKRGLHALGLRNPGLSKVPIRRRSSRRAREEAARELRRIAETADPILSTDTQLELVWSRSRDKLEQLRTDCLAENPSL